MTPISSRVATRVSWSPLSGLKGVQPPLPFAQGPRAAPWRARPPSAPAPPPPRAASLPSVGQFPLRVTDPDGVRPGPAQSRCRTLGSLIPAPRSRRPRKPLGGGCFIQADTDTIVFHSVSPSPVMNPSYCAIAVVPMLALSSGSSSMIHHSHHTAFSPDIGV